MHSAGLARHSVRGAYARVSPDNSLEGSGLALSYPLCRLRSPKGARERPKAAAGALKEGSGYFPSAVLAR